MVNVMGEFAILKSPQAMREWACLRKQEGREGREGHSLVLVPTMGALHDGHLSLLRLAKASGDDVIVSIYVNPTQFGLHEDFDHYPRRLKADLATLRKCGVEVSAVYVPETQHMYRDSFASEISVPSLSRHLCGRTRPNYFSGVAMVVAKLLHQTFADKAVFGEKDYQQLMVIRRMVADLDFAVEILAAPTMRDDDGLALSSRNAYLTDEERGLAPFLYATLCECGEAIKGGGQVNRILSKGRKRLRDAGFGGVDYLHLVRADDLAVVNEVSYGEGGEGYRLVSAVYLGSARLIDNIGVEIV